MTDSSDTSAGSIPPGPSSRRAGPLVRFGLRISTLLIACVVALLVSNNWCVILLPVAIVASLVDTLFDHGPPWLLRRTLVAALVGAGMGWLLIVRPAWAFKETFGIDPPPGVSDVHIWRHYVGGPGEHILITEFRATPNALGTLTSLGGAKITDRVRKWQPLGAGWEAAYDAFHGPAPWDGPRKSWMRISALNDPQVYDFGGYRVESGTLVLLHERGSDRCVSMHVRY